MMDDLVQKTIEGRFKDYYELFEEFIDKCDYCGDYKRIVALNCYGIEKMCHDCSMLFFKADINGRDNENLRKLREKVVFQR